MYNNNKFSDLEVLGKNLRTLRESKNISIKDVALKVHYNRNSLSKLENGEQNIRLNTLIEISKVLDIDLRELFSRNFVNNLGLDSVCKFNKDINYLNCFVNNVCMVVKSESLVQAHLYIENENNNEMDAASINRVLRGTNKNPCMFTLAKIAKGIDRQLYDLFRYEYK